jgi:hypothetical protein
MRFKEFRTVLKEASGNLYTIGDSHAVAVATAGGSNWINLAIGGKSSTDAGMLANIAKVPKGATVLVSQGANDTANAMKAAEMTAKPPKDPKIIASNVANVVTKVQAQGATVIFLLFPNGPGRGPGLAKYYGGDYQEDVRTAIKSAIGNVQIIDINGKPLTDGVHATMGVYKEVAGQVAAKVTAPSTGNKPNLNTIAGFKRDGLPIIPANPELDASGKLTGKSDPRSTTFSITTPTSKRSADVADLQKALLALGYPLPRHGVDGIRGPETNGAIKKFQADNNLEPSGEPNKDTVAKLNDILKTKPEVASKLTKSTLADIGYQPGAGGGTGGGAGATGNAKKAVEYFIAKGWTPEQAAGIVGNLQAESGANLNTAAVGDGGKAYGIAQWHPDRQAKFAKAFGKNISQSDLTDQLAFVQWELDNDESKAASWLKRAKTADEAAWVFDKYYERSAGLHTSRRVANATALLPTTA